MSLQRTNGTGLISPEEYVANQAKIDQARKVLEDMEYKNRAGLQNFAEAERERERIQGEVLRQKQALERKVQEGLEAQRLIQELEKQQLLALAPGSRIGEPNYSNARIEEVPPGKQGQSEQHTSRNAQSSRTSISSFPSYPHNQGQLLPVQQQPQPHYPPQWQGYGNADPIPANPTIQYQHSSLYQVPNTWQDQRNQSQYASTSQQVHHNGQLAFRHDNPPMHQQPASSFTSQSIPQSSHGTFIAPYHSGTLHVQQQQQPPPQQQPQVSSLQPYQPYSVKTGQPNVPAVSNNLRNQMKPMATGATSSPNSSSQPSTSIHATTTNYAGPAASQMKQNSQIHVQSQSPYIDALGVPFLSITDQEISALRKRVDHWILHAPPGSKNHLHEMLVLYKDSDGTHPKSWIYVPWEPGSIKYARTYEIDKFFVALAGNARLVASGAVSVPKRPSTILPDQSSSAQQPTVTKSATQSTRATFTGQNLVLINNNQNQQTVVSSSLATASTNKTSTSSLTTQAPIGAPVTNPVSNPPSTQPPTGMSVTSSTPTSTPSSVQTPTSPPVAIPSGLTRNLPTPSQVDKKHLTKHILFALGKRSRPSFETSSPEQPTKRHAAEAKSTVGAGESNTPSSNIAELSSRPALQNAGERPLAPTASTSTDALRTGDGVKPSSLGVTAAPLETPPAPHAPAHDTRPAETSSISNQVIPGSSSIASISVATIPHFSASDSQSRQQSMPSIAAARPDLIQPTPIPATAAQTDTKMNSPPSAVNSSSRFSVPPIETLDFATTMETQPTGSTAASRANTTAASSQGSEPTPVAKDSNASAAVTGPSIAASQPSNLTYQRQTTTSSISTGTTTMTNGQTMQTSWRTIASGSTSLAPTPAMTKYPGQSQFQAVPPAGSSIPNINPYAWLLSSGPQPQTSSFSVQPGSSFSYNQIAHGPSASTSKSTSKSKASSKSMAPSEIKEPLFLPSSSPASPERGPSSRPVEETKRDRGKEVMAYVLVPKADYPIRHHPPLEEKGEASEIEVTRNRLKRLRTQSSSVSTSVVGEEVWDNTFATATEGWRDSPTTDPGEGEAVRLAYSRLQDLPCRWDGCDVRLNSVNKLVEHLRQHKPQPHPHHQNTHFTCRWTQCGRRCTLKDAHLENHALQPLRCAYQNCSESYRTPSQLVKHFNAKHINGMLKSSAELSKPELIEAPLIPGSIPAYLFVTELAKPATISPERHQVLCQLVVRNIVNSDQEKPTKRPRKTAKPSSDHTLAMGHDYEFIKARSTRYSSYLSQAVDLPLEDLDSESITRMVDEGLMLWSPESGETDMVAYGADAEVRTPMISSTGDIKVETDDAVLRATDATDLDRHLHEHSTDEDAVEVMLTEVSA